MYKLKNSNCHASIDRVRCLLSTPSNKPLEAFPFSLSAKEAYKKLPSTISYVGCSVALIFYHGVGVLFSIQVKRTSKYFIKILKNVSLSKRYEEQENLTRTGTSQESNDFFRFATGDITASCTTTCCAWYTW